MRRLIMIAMMVISTLSGCTINVGSDDKEPIKEVVKEVVKLDTIQVYVNIEPGFSYQIIDNKLMRHSEPAIGDTFTVMKAGNIRWLNDSAGTYDPTLVKPRKYIKTAIGGGVKLIYSDSLYRAINKNRITHMKANGWTEVTTKCNPFLNDSCFRGVPVGGF